jgi:plasmid stabilization system protein ParE
MENGVELKEVVSSVELEEDLKEIYLYSLETFGSRKADEYLNSLKSAIRELDVCYLMHSECRQLPTKGKIYRRILAGSHIIVYRRSRRIEVLRVFHQASSNFKIRTVRKVKIW